MKSEDFDRLKAVCEKEGFIISQGGVIPSHSILCEIYKKDIWDGVEFYKNHMNIIKPMNDEVRFHLKANCGVSIDPATELAYIEQLKSEAFKRFGEIKEGDKMFTEFDGETFMIDSGHGFDYRKRFDELRFNGWSIYRKGKWATKLPVKTEGENPRFLAICTTPTWKSFRYEDGAKDMICFIQYVKEIYPDFEIESVTSL